MISSTRLGSCFGAKVREEEMCTALGSWTEGREGWVRKGGKTETSGEVERVIALVNR